MPLYIVGQGGRLVTIGGISHNGRIGLKVSFVDDRERRLGDNSASVSLDPVRPHVEGPAPTSRAPQPDSERWRRDGAVHARDVNGGMMHA